MLRIFNPFFLPFAHVCYSSIVEYATREEAQDSIKTLSDQALMGRPVFIREVHHISKHFFYKADLKLFCYFVQDRESEAKFGAAPTAGRGGFAGARASSRGGYGGEGGRSVSRGGHGGEGARSFSGNGYGGEGGYNATESSGEVTNLFVGNVRSYGKGFTTRLLIHISTRPQLPYNAGWQGKNVNQV